MERLLSGELDRVSQSRHHRWSEPRLGRRSGPVSVAPLVPHWLDEVARMGRSRRCVPKVGPRVARKWSLAASELVWYLCSPAGTVGALDLLLQM